MTDSIVVAAALARMAGRGGHAWALLQYLLGFRRLGFDVAFVDRIEGDAAGHAGARAVSRTMALFGLQNDFVVLDESGESIAGLGRNELLGRVERSLMLLNVMGYLDDEAVLEAAPRRVFLDIDPGYPQMWHALGLADLLTGHDDYVTIGLNIGEPDCAIPTCGLDWITTVQPIVMEEWPVSDGGSAFTSVATWRGPYGVLDYEGRRYGSRLHEFRKFIAIPALAGGAFELALDIHPEEKTDIGLLHASGWKLLDPAAVTGDPLAYRAFIQGSKAEFSVSKLMYVDTRSGWLSDRSICYLASGKPVVTQDTGLERLGVVSGGLLTYATQDEALAAIEDVRSDPVGHAAAARALAEEHFDSGRVLSRLLEEVVVA